jgi:Co/Zn/Cd efflux system component
MEILTATLLFIAAVVIFVSILSIAAQRLMSPQHITHKNTWKIGASAFFSN